MGSRQWREVIGGPCWEASSAPASTWGASWAPRELDPPPGPQPPASLPRYPVGSAQQGSGLRGAAAKVARSPLGTLQGLSDLPLPTMRLGVGDHAPCAAVAPPRPRHCPCRDDSVHIHATEGVVWLPPERPCLRGRVSTCRLQFPPRHVTSGWVPCAPPGRWSPRALRVGGACVGQPGAASLRLVPHIRPGKLSSRKRAESVFRAGSTSQAFDGRCCLPTKRTPLQADGWSPKVRGLRRLPSLLLPRARPQLRRKLNSSAVKSTERNRPPSQDERSISTPGSWEVRGECSSVLRESRCSTAWARVGVRRSDLSRRWVWAASARAAAGWFPGKPGQAAAHGHRC